MFHLVNHGNRSRYAPQLEAMHRLRREMFKGRPFGGPEAAATGQGPADQFDDDLALYLIRLDSFSEIVCCARLRPTQETSLIGTYYPEAIGPGEAPVAGAATWEFSQYYARDSVSPATHDKLRAEMRLAVLAAALEASVSRVVLIAEIERSQMILGSGWNVRTLGPPFAYGDGAYAVAFGISVQLEDLVVFRRRLDDELRASVGGYDRIGNVSGLANSLGPAALSVVNTLSRRLAEVEETEGAEAALALAESLERALRMESPS